MVTGDPFDVCQQEGCLRASANENVGHQAVQVSVVHGPQNYERVRKALTESNENITDQQFTKRRVEGFHDVEERMSGRPRDGGNVVSAVFGHELLKQNRGRAHADADATRR